MLLKWIKCGKLHCLILDFGTALLTYFSTNFTAIMALILTWFLAVLLAYIFAGAIPLTGYRYDKIYHIAIKFNLFDMYVYSICTWYM